MPRTGFADAVVRLIAVASDEVSAMIPEFLRHHYHPAIERGGWRFTSRATGTRPVPPPTPPPPAVTVALADRHALASLIEVPSSVDALFACASQIGPDLRLTALERGAQAILEVPFDVGALDAATGEVAGAFEWIRDRKLEIVEGPPGSPPSD